MYTTHVLHSDMSQFCLEVWKKIRIVTLKSEGNGYSVHQQHLNP